MKLYSQLGGEECIRRLTSSGFEYTGKHTHDSFLFNHYEIWFEFGGSGLNLDTEMEKKNWKLSQCSGIVSLLSGSILVLEQLHVIFGLVRERAQN